MNFHNMALEYRFRYPKPTDRVDVYPPDDWEWGDWIPAVVVEGGSTNVPLKMMCPGMPGIEEKDIVSSLRPQDVKLHHTLERWKKYLFI